MQHTSCIEAIQKHQRDPAKANVNDTIDGCLCRHMPTKCDWIGYGIRYACLGTTNDNSQRVYTQMNFTKHARIESPRNSPTSKRRG